MALSRDFDLDMYSSPGQNHYYRMMPEAYDDPQSDVDALIHKYAAITSITETVFHIVKSPEYLELFNEVFAHHISLIKSRSQSFEDGHITVYDKALLILTNNGESLYNMGAIELFKDEILGIRRNEGIGSLNSLFSKNIALRAILMFATGKPNSELGGSIPTEPAATSNSASAPPPVNNGNPSKDLVAAMFKTFRKAQSEYDSVRNTNHQSKYKAAKFLRDSAENTHKYLLENDPGHHMIPLLKGVFNMAQAKTMAMNGGKKRPFEYSEEEDGMGARRRQRQKMRKRQKIRGDCYRPS